MAQENDTTMVKIGELLIEVGVLSSGDLTEAIQISKRMGVPIGRVLVMSGCVNDVNLQYALELQSLLKDGLCDWETGIKALKKVFVNHMNLDSALKELNWAPRLDGAGNKLGDLLVDSSIVSKPQLDRALETSFQSGMPLGGTLVLQGVLSPQLLPTVLHIQEQIRDGKLNREDAVGSLKQAVMFWARAVDQSKKEDLQGLPAQPQSASQAQPPSQPAEAQQELVSATANVAAGLPGASGQQLPPVPKVPPPPPKPAVQSHSKLSTVGGDAQTTASTTVDSLPTRAAQQSGTNASSDAANPEEISIVSLVELMKLSGFCTQGSLEQAIDSALQDSRLASKMLLSIGFLDGPALNNFVHCQALIARGKIRTDQALFALNSIRHRQITLEQAIEELGIDATL